MAAPRGPRPGNAPPNYNPSSLADGMQNLQINRPVGQPPSVPNSGGTRHRPPYGQQPPPFSSLAPGASPMTRPGPPPPGVFPRSSVPAGGPPQATLSPNVVPNRPSGPPPVNQPPPPFGVRPPLPGSLPSSMSSSSVPPSGPPGVFPSSGQVGPPSSQPFGSYPLTRGPVMPPSSTTGPISNGPPAFGSGALQGGPPFPSAGSSSSQPPPPAVGPAPPAMLSTAPHPASNMLSHLGSRPIGAPPGHMQPAAPFSAPSQGVPPPPGSSPFSGPPQGVSPPLGSPYGAQAWPMQPHQVAPPPPIPGSAQQTRMFGMPPQPPNQSMATISPAMGLMGTSMAGPSKIDPNQIPRPIPNSSVIIHETRQGNQANPPPPTTSDYIVKDTGNCSPRYLRCTINQIPCTVDLLTSSGMQLALMVQPMALPHPSEEPIQVVDFGESGPVRCSRCKGYINPFVKFIDQGRRFICNFCGFTDETPRDYHCNLGPDGRRRDAEERPELCRGTVEFVATKEYMVRDPMPAVFFFLIDVSMNAIQTGATAAACSAINQVIADLPEGPRTMVGVATFDSTIHFYNLKRALQQPLMLIVPDVQDVYTPLQTDVIVQLSECRQHLVLLLENIPTMFQNNRTSDSAFGAAVKAAFLAMKSTGGKLLVFQSVLPSVGIGALSAREAEGRTNISAGEKEAHKLLQPADKILKTLAVELAEYQVCVDVFITTQSYVDIASISVIPRTTGGQRGNDFEIYDSERTVGHTATASPKPAAAGDSNCNNAACVLVPGGFGDRGAKGMMLAAKYARENKVPYLGICLGMQISIIEYARSVLGWEKANSTEFDNETPNPVVHIFQSSFFDFFIFLHACIILYSLFISRYHNSEYVDERHRHRYEVNPDMIDMLEEAGLKFVGKDESGKRMEAVLETVAKVTHDKGKKNETQEANGTRSFQFQDVFSLENEGSDDTTFTDKKDNVFVMSNKKSKYPILQVDLRLISDLVVVIVSAAIAGIIFSCLGQPVIVGYLLADSLIGPGGLNFISEMVLVRNFLERCKIWSKN